jgi:hypothetical protein
MDGENKSSETSTSKMETETNGESTAEKEIDQQQRNNYFETSISNDLICNPDDVIQMYKEPDSIYKNDDNELIFGNKQFEDHHTKYANKLQLYYTLLKKETVGEDQDLINIRELTPVLIQRTEGILSTLLFITLDQNHDYRGGRTSGSDSWVTVKSPTFITKIKRGQTGIDFPMNNEYLNTLVNTSFSGLKSIIGLLIMDDVNNTIFENDYFENGKLNITEILFITPNKNFKNSLIFIRFSYII